MADKANSNSVK